jgi:hypothetical protein
MQTIIKNIDSVDSLLIELKMTYLTVVDKYARAYKKTKSQETIREFEQEMDWCLNNSVQRALHNNVGKHEQLAAEGLIVKAAAADKFTRLIQL